LKLHPEPGGNITSPLLGANKTDEACLRFESADSADYSGVV